MKGQDSTFSMSTFRESSQAPTSMSKIDEAKNKAATATKCGSDDMQISPRKLSLTILKAKRLSSGLAFSSMDSLFGDTTHRRTQMKNEDTQISGMRSAQTCSLQGGGEGELWLGRAEEQ